MTYCIGYLQERALIWNYCTTKRPPPSTFEHISHIDPPYGCESWKLTAQARRKLNGTVSKMLLRIRGRTIADEARDPTLDALMRARDRRWNWLGTSSAWKSTRVIPTSTYELRQANPGLALRRCPRPRSRKAAEIAKDRVKKEENLFCFESCRRICWRSGPPFPSESPLHSLRSFRSYRVASY